MTDKEKAITELIDALVGSTLDFNAECAARGLDDMDDAVTDAVDQDIFLCTECGWWHEQYDEVSFFIDHDEWVCRTCAIEEHDWDGEE